jgi:hypothetical protein
MNALPLMAQLERHVGRLRYIVKYQMYLESLQGRLQSIA